MENVIFYHFLTTKAKAEENKRKGQDSRAHEWEVVEKRATPKTIAKFLFPWEIKYVITTKDLGSYFELSPEHVWEHILKHWAESDMLSLTIHGKKMKVLIRDMDTKTTHRLSVRRCKESGRFTIKGSWYKEFVERRSLKEGMLVGLYWDAGSSSLHFSVLDNLEN